MEPEVVRLRRAGSSRPWLGVLLFLSGGVACGEPPLSWDPVAASPIPRCEAGALRLGNEVHVFGGFEGAGEGDVLFASQRIDAYDLDSGRWRRLGDMPVATTHWRPAFDGRFVWFAGGFEGDHPGATTDRVWRYEPANGEWKEGPPLPAARAGGALVALEGALHYFGGFGVDRDTTHSDHWTLDLETANDWARGGSAQAASSASSGWQSRAPLGDARGHLGAAVVDGRIFAIGGQHRHDNDPVDVTTVEVYESGHDVWRTLAPLRKGRSHFEPGTIVIDSRIMIVGGRANGDAEVPWAGLVSDIDVYSPLEDRWESAGSLPVPLFGAVAAVFDDKLVVATGCRDSWKNPTASVFRTSLPVVSGASIR